MDKGDPSEPEIWVDVTQSHECVHSHVKPAALHFIKVLQRAREPSAPLPEKVPPALRKAERDKKSKYAELVRIASLGGSTPTFLPFAISPEGVLGPGAVAVVKFLVSTYARNAKQAPPRLDALPASYLISDFRRRLSSAIACAAARGFGKMLNRASANAFGARAAGVAHAAGGG